MTIDQHSPRTNIRYRIVLVSILMAFGLYLTRVSVGEIVKSDSFLKDERIVSNPSTRFSVELASVDDASTFQQKINPPSTTSSTSIEPKKLNLPMTWKDGLTRQEAEETLKQIESAGGEGKSKISKQQIGSVLGAFFFTYALFQVPAGWFSDRLGARKVLSGYIFLWSLLTGITGMVTGLYGLMFARLGFGFTQAGAYPTSSAIVRRWFPLSERGNASAFISLGGRCGGTVAPFLTTMLILYAGGWRMTLWIYAIMGIAIAAAYYLVVRDRPIEHPDCNESERAWIGPEPVQDPTKSQNLFAILWRICRNPSLTLNSIEQFCINIGWAYLITWLPTYLKEVQKVSDSQGALMVSIVLGMGMLGQLVGGYAADWSVKRFGLRIGRVVPITTSTWIAGCAYLLCLRMDSAWGVVACCAVVSMMTDVGNPSIWAFMQDIGGRNTGAIFGWANMWGNFGAAFSSKLIPFILAYSTSFMPGQTLVFLTCAGAFFIAGLAALGMNATKPLYQS